MSDSETTPSDPQDHCPECGERGRFDPLLTAEQLADHYGVTRATIYNLMKRGMPSLKIGRARRFRLAECDSWLEGEQNTAQAA